MGKHTKPKTRLYEQYWYARRMWHGIWKDALRARLRNTLTKLAKIRTNARKNLTRFF